MDLGSHFGSKLVWKSATPKVTFAFWPRLLAARAKGYPKTFKIAAQAIQRPPKPTPNCPKQKFFVFLTDFELVFTPLLPPILDHKSAKMR